MGATIADDAPVPMPATADVGTQVLDFARLMKHEQGRRTLLEFAKKEHSEENLIFYDKAQSFRKSHVRNIAAQNPPALTLSLTHCMDCAQADVTDDEQTEVMRQEAVGLIDQFLREDSMFALNLPSANPFKKGLPPTATPAANMFDPVCRVIHKSIEQDIFPRFKQSSFGMELLAKIPQLAKRMSGSGHSTNRSTNSDHPEPPPAASPEQSAFKMKFHS